MFEKLFKNLYRSKKTVSAEKAEDIREQIERLKEDNKLREAQIVKFGRLLHEDPIHKDRYVKRINIHNKMINDNKKTIQELEITLLDS